MLFCEALHAMNKSSVMQDITNAEYFRFAQFCVLQYGRLMNPQWYQRLIRLIKIQKQFLFRQFLLGDCPKLNLRLYVGISGMCIWSQASLCIHE